MHPVQSWLRDLLKLFVQYVAVAFCSIPATLIYFLILKTGANGNWAMLGSLLTGFGCAYLAWKFLDRSILLAGSRDTARVERTITSSAQNRNPMTTGVTYGIGSIRLAGFAVTMVFSGIPVTDAMDLSRPTSRIAIRDTVTSLEGLDVAA